MFVRFCQGLRNLSESVVYQSLAFILVVYLLSSSYFFHRLYFGSSRMAKDVYSFDSGALEET